MATRPTGRAVFYTRDSGGEHETTPAQYVQWAQRAAAERGARFAGTPDRIERMIRTGRWADGDLFLDYGVKGNTLSRKGLDALIRTAETDRTVSHVFIPRRDRLLRPEEAVEGLRLEGTFHRLGVTLVFMDRVSAPRGRGRGQIGELIVSLIDYDKAGEDRRQLAQKILFGQLTLAREGFSTGGRPPYGFRRWLVKADGRQVRQLADGEIVRMAGHHVVWLPGEDEREWATIRRILELLPTTPASRVARLLTSEGVPPPDAGRVRTDRGVRHATSGVWHQVTVTGIARNPLLRAVVEYGRRSMGDQLRFDPTEPRELTESDRRADQKPKVVVNPPEARVTAPARFAPPVGADQLARATAALDRRSGTQRGKPRAHDPARNPLGCRVFDCGCGWPMYRQPYNGSFRYACGLYQQSHGAECAHNTMDGVGATRLVLSCVRQRVVGGAGFRDRLRQKLEELARRDQGRPDPAETERAALERSLSEARQKRERAEGNLALANGEDQYRAVSKMFEQFLREERELAARLEAMSPTPAPSQDGASRVEAALAAFDRLAELADEATNLGAVGELFTRLNARLFLRFGVSSWGKRTVNRVSGGVVTFGLTAPPVRLYEGPTGRRALPGRPELQVEGVLQPSESVQDPQVSGGEGDSLGNVSRADWI